MHRVEAVEVDSAGRRERIACDGVVFTGRFVPEAALFAGSHLEVDPATGGPAIDQHWRCSDPAYFAAGNLLRPVETAATAWREGRAAAEAIAAALAGRLPDAAREVRIGWSAPLRYVYPQRLSLPGWPVHPLLLRARAARPARGRIGLVANGAEIWSQRISVLPERRIQLPGDRVPLDRLETLSVVFAEAGAAAAPEQSDRKPQTSLTERSTPGTVSDKLTPGDNRAAE